MFSNQTFPHTHQYFAVCPDPVASFLFIGPFTLKPSADFAAECRNAVERGEARRSGASPTDLDNLPRWRTSRRPIWPSRSK